MGNQNNTQGKAVVSTLLMNSLPNDLGNVTSTLWKVWDTIPSTKFPVKPKDNDSVSDFLFFGGRMSARTFFEKKVYQELDCLIFVDQPTPPNTGRASLINHTQLVDILANNSARDVPILVLVDMPKEALKNVSAQQLLQRLHLKPEFRHSRPFRIQCCCLGAGLGIKEGLEWLLNAFEGGETYDHDVAPNSPQQGQQGQQGQQEVEGAPQKKAQPSHPSPSLEECIYLLDKLLVSNPNQEKSQEGEGSASKRLVESKVAPEGEGSGPNKAPSKPSSPQPPSPQPAPSQPLPQNPSSAKPNEKQPPH